MAISELSCAGKIAEDDLRMRALPFDTTEQKDWTVLK
jgi:hypothetical protein